MIDFVSGSVMHVCNEHMGHPGLFFTDYIIEVRQQSPFPKLSHGN